MRFPFGASANGLAVPFPQGKPLAATLERAIEVAFATISRFLPWDPGIQQENAREPRIEEREHRLAVLSYWRFITLSPVPVRFNIKATCFRLGTDTGPPPYWAPRFASYAPWTMARDAQLFLEWQEAGVIDVRPRITHRYPWRQVTEAYQMLREDRSRALGVILDWSAP